MPNPKAVAEMRDRIFSRSRADWHSTVEAVLLIMGQQSLLESNPLLGRSIRNCFLYLDSLNELKRYRAGDADDDVVTGIHRTTTGPPRDCGTADNQVQRRVSPYAIRTDI